MPSGLTLVKTPVKYIDIHSFNQYSKRATFSRVVVTKKLLTEGLEWVEKVGARNVHLLREQDLWEKYRGVTN